MEHIDKAKTDEYLDKGEKYYNEFNEMSLDLEKEEEEYNGSSKYPDSISNNIIEIGKKISEIYKIEDEEQDTINTILGWIYNGVLVEDKLSCREGNLYRFSCRFTPNMKTIYTELKDNLHEITEKLKRNPENLKAFEKIYEILNNVEGEVLDSHKEYLEKLFDVDSNVIRILQERKKPFFVPNYEQRRKSDRSFKQDIQPVDLISLHDEGEIVFHLSFFEGVESSEDLKFDDEYCFKKEDFNDSGDYDYKNQRYKEEGKLKGSKVVLGKSGTYLLTNKFETEITTRQQKWLEVLEQKKQQEQAQLSKIKQIGSNLLLLAQIEKGNKW